MLFFGLESFDQKFLDNINKGINVKYAIKILQLCKKYDIKTSVSFLFNFPLENLHTLIKNNGQDFNLSKEELELVNLLA